MICVPWMVATGIAIAAFIGVWLVAISALARNEHAIGVLKNIAMYERSVPSGCSVHLCTPDTTQNVNDWGKYFWQTPKDDGYEDKYSDAIMACWNNVLSEQTDD